jgi:hypothetical protein
VINESHQGVWLEEKRQQWIWNVKSQQQIWW